MSVIRRDYISAKAAADPSVTAEVMRCLSATGGTPAQLFTSGNIVSACAQTVAQMLKVGESVPQLGAVSICLTLATGTLLNFAFEVKQDPSDSMRAIITSAAGTTTTVLLADTALALGGLIAAGVATVTTAPVIAAVAGAVELPLLIRTPL